MHFLWDDVTWCTRLLVRPTLKTMSMTAVDHGVLWRDLSRKPPLVTPPEPYLYLAQGCPVEHVVPVRLIRPGAVRPARRGQLLDRIPGFAKTRIIDAFRRSDLDF